MAYVWLSDTWSRAHYCYYHWESVGPLIMLVVVPAVYPSSCRRPRISNLDFSQPDYAYDEWAERLWLVAFLFAYGRSRRFHEGGKSFGARRIAESKWGWIALFMTMRHPPIFRGGPGLWDIWIGESGSGVSLVIERNWGLFVLFCFLHYIRVMNCFIPTCEIWF